MKKINLYINITLLLLVTEISRAEIYQYRDAGGQLHFTDQAPKLKRVKINVLSNYGKKIKTRRTKIYRHIDKDGIIHLTDTPSSSTYKLIYTGKQQYRYRKKTSNKYKEIIQDIAERTNLEPELLHAVIKTESAYNNYALSPKGAAGLMQLMPATAKSYGVDNRYDPEMNIYGGAKYLSYLLNKFNNNMKLALAAYNAGEYAVKKYDNSIPPYKETRNYVHKVLNLYENYKK
jgi:soluble lytic murein transglycosylase-like protein